MDIWWSVVVSVYLKGVGDGQTHEARTQTVSGYDSKQSGR